MTMQAALWFIFSATALKTLLVADAVWDATGRHGLVVRVAACVKGNGRTAQEGHATPVAGSFTKRGLPLAQVRPGSGRLRRKTLPKLVHVWLLGMHFLALLAQGAAVYEYLVPVTDSMCLRTRRVMLPTFILFDSALVLFLLAKTDVTSVNRAGASRPALWERVTKRCSYLWACVLMPVEAAVLTSWSCGGASVDGEGCTAGIEHVHSGVRQPFVVMYLLGKFMLGVQLLVLLVLFLKPIVAARGQIGHLSALQRRTVVRNIVCTIGVIILHIIEGAIVYIVVFSEFDEEVAQGGDDEDGVVGDSGDDFHDFGSGLDESQVEIAEHRGSDAAQMIQTLLTLCLTEITITLGFTSAIKSCRSNVTQWPPVAPWARKRNAALFPSGEIEEAALDPTASNSNDSEGRERGTDSWEESTKHVATVEEQYVASASGASRESAPSHHTAGTIEANDHSPCR
ncbi:unnamed protein product [Scytosiphon promiscuus]